MSKLRIGIVREEKVPSDKRVPLIPSQCEQLLSEFDDLEVVVQPSDVRAIPDASYRSVGMTLSEDLSSCDVLMGVKEVQASSLIPNKNYFFFSHTIKEQPYNRGLLKAMAKLGITLIDWETLTAANGNRILGFGRYAGIVGAYNGLLAYGKRSKRFDLKPAHVCDDQQEMNDQLRLIDLPPIKIALTGKGRVASGAIETLTNAGIRRVSVHHYLTQVFDEPVFTQLGVEDYNKRRDSQPGSRSDFFANYTDYESDFMRFAEITDMFIAGHFYAEGSPYLFTREDAAKASFKIKVVADISCDIDGPVACTLRPSTIADPIYGYNPKTQEEGDAFSKEHITVMAVDNLPCELPIDASRDFGTTVMNTIIPELMNENSELLNRAKVLDNGKLTGRFEYLTDYLNG